MLANGGHRKPGVRTAAGRCARRTAEPSSTPAAPTSFKFELGASAVGGRSSNRWPEGKRGARYGTGRRHRAEKPDSLFGDTRHKCACAEIADTCAPPSSSRGAVAGGDGSKVGLSCELAPSPSRPARFPLPSCRMQSVAVLTVEGVLDTCNSAALRDPIVKTTVDEPSAVIVNVSAASSACAVGMVDLHRRPLAGRSCPDVPIVLVSSHRATREALSSSEVASLHAGPSRPRNRR